MNHSGLTFIIVGASVSGLASAIALKSVGHNVVILEKEIQLGGGGSVPNGSGCARIPPNGCKILLEWGLEAEIKANSVSVSGFSAYKYAEREASGPDHLGINRYDEEMLSEARGAYSHFAHQDLVRILYEFAVKPASYLGTAETAQLCVIFGAEVVHIDSEACSVTLRSGEIHKGDAIIGADGINGVVRRFLMEEEEASSERDVPTGLAVYSAIVPNTLVQEHDLSVFCHYLCTIWAGPDRGLKTFSVGKENDISLLIYTPDSTQDGTWTQETEKPITDVLGPCDKHILKIAALAGPATCLQIKQHYDLESWVSKSGRVLALGDAAHPFPPGSVQTYAVALEDGKFIGKIFSHTVNPARVPEFLRAFQEHREPRCTRIRQMEMEYISFLTLPDGELQEERDASMRELHAAGQDVFEGDLEQLQEDLRMVFGYEASDDADEWWMAWGRYRDPAEASPLSSGTQAGLFNIKFSSSTSQASAVIWRR
ncbi:hypothetical protein DFH08DRAFT_866037 [Mycena albidolilacea]|uniref:FAD-binding domain-containing protein n=1 Tax=Mycena albidolilacea TaxID=1033008 RepID=A0AAD7A2X5_9AGAR|nr:hypothetical protein DFH08DRAFT_866037 [Mycena albidolilacea]